MEDNPKQQQQQCVILLHKPSGRELAFFFASGILVSVPFALIFENLSFLASFSLTLVVLAPFIEELAKVFPLFYRHGETERSIVTLGILIGLGFGISEFVAVCLRGHTVHCQDPSRYLSCFKRRHHRVRHRQEKSVALLFDISVASYCK